MAGTTLRSRPADTKPEVEGGLEVPPRLLLPNRMMGFEQTSTEIQRLTLNIAFPQGKALTLKMKDLTGRCLLPFVVQTTQFICLKTWVVFAPP